MHIFSGIPWPLDEGFLSYGWTITSFNDKIRNHFVSFSSLSYCFQAPPREGTKVKELKRSFGKVGRDETRSWLRIGPSGRILDNRHQVIGNCVTTESPHGRLSAQKVIHRGQCRLKYSEPVFVLFLPRHGCKAACQHFVSAFVFRSHWRFCKLTTWHSL